MEALELGATTAQPSAPEQEAPVPGDPKFNQFAADEYSDFEDDTEFDEVLKDLGYVGKKKEKK